MNAKYALLMEAKLRKETNAKVLDTRRFMNDRIEKANYYGGAMDKLSKMLQPYNVVDSVSILPDFTDANSLPIGVTAVIRPNAAINPALIGMDIGCGYQFFSADINSKRFYKKDRLKQGGTSMIVGEIDHEIKEGISEPDTSFGTIGRGNHFIDMFVVEEVFDADVCRRAGIDPGRVYFLIHSGSREKGFKIHTNFTKEFNALNGGDVSRFNYNYLTAFKQAKDYARGNRDKLREDVIKAIGGYSAVNPNLLFDKSHNDIQVMADGNIKLKKGTSSLAPGEVFVIPGTAVDSSYMVVGEEGLKDSNNTINHGAGRTYTREQIFCKFRRKNFDNLFRDVVLNVPVSQMIEEIPKGYKNIEDIIDSVEQFKLARRIVKLKPVGVIVERK